MTQIIEYPTAQTHTITLPGQDATIDDLWHHAFNIPAALDYVDNIIADKGSDRTPEQHTRKSYASGLGEFFKFAGGTWPTGWNEAAALPLRACTPSTWHRFPAPDLVRAYIAHLKRDRGLAKSTIDNKYMAPLRHYLRGLRRQVIPVRGDARDMVNDCKDYLLLSLEERVSAHAETGTNLPALDTHGTWLKAHQTEEIFHHLLYKTEDGQQVPRVLGLSDRRDLAILYIGFTVGLRDAEIRRLTLNDIEPGKFNSPWQITVRGKRNNTQPVPLDFTGHGLIQSWIAMYNNGLAGDDPRRITENTPIFQPLRRGDNYSQTGVNGFDPQRGLSKSSVWGIVKRRSRAGCGVEITPHDMRRTMAAQMRKDKKPYDIIQLKLRHASISTTQKYVGEVTDFAEAMIEIDIDFQIAI